MITLISATNRRNSNAQRVTDFYAKRLEKQEVPHVKFSLLDLPSDLFTPEMYNNNTHPGMIKIQEEILIPTTKYIFIVPEYNGSFPGILKAFIDASDIKRCFHNKKACLLGEAAGRAGNLRGMDHLTNIFNHMKMNVLNLKIPISSVESHLDANGEIKTPEIIGLIDQQIEQYLNF